MGPSGERERKGEKCEFVRAKSKSQEPQQHVLHPGLGSEGAVWTFSFAGIIYISAKWGPRRRLVLHVPITRHYEYVQALLLKAAKCVNPRGRDWQVFQRGGEQRFRVEMSLFFCSVPTGKTTPFPAEWDAQLPLSECIRFDLSFRYAPWILCFLSLFFSCPRFRLNCLTPHRSDWHLLVTTLFVGPYARALLAFNVVQSRGSSIIIPEKIYLRQTLWMLCATVHAD